MAWLVVGDGRGGGGGELSPMPSKRANARSRNPSPSGIFLYFLLRLSYFYEDCRWLCRPMDDHDDDAVLDVSHLGKKERRGERERENQSSDGIHIEKGRAPESPPPRLTLQRNIAF